MRIYQNINALYITNKLRNNNFKKLKALEKVSSGHAINTGADSPAGLAISEKMRGQIRGLIQAERNI